MTAVEASVQQAWTSPGEAKASILIVDDRDENLIALEAVLLPLGQRLLKATSGDEALKHLLKEDVAVILLDVQMPGLDGFETAAYIKQLERTKHIPIIFLTAISKEARHVFRGYSAGAVDYIFKPFDPEVLRSKVTVFIDLHNKKTALQQSEERFRKAFSHAPIGIGLVTRAGLWLAVNRSLREMTGYEEADLIGIPVTEMLASDVDPIDFDRLARELSLSQRSMEDEVRLLRRTGEVMEALLNISFVAGQAEESQFIIQMIDITQRKQLEAFREQFVASAAHELRTPASVIAGTSSLLHQAGLKMSRAELEKCFNLLERQTHRMTSMVNRLLDLTRLRQGKIEVEIQPVDVSQLVKNTLEQAPPPEEKSVNVKVDEGLRVLADVECIEHVLTNLLTNAYRYGGSTIDISAEQADGHVRISVADDGAGIAPDLAARLFEPFTRGREASRVGGSGLGLALVKGMLEAIGGEVSYVDSIGGGAAFVVTLEAGS